MTIELTIALQAWTYAPSGDRLGLGGTVQTCEPAGESNCVRVDVGGVRFYMSAARLLAAAQCMYIAALPPGVYRVEVPQIPKQ